MKLTLLCLSAVLLVSCTTPVAVPPEPSPLEVGDMVDRVLNGTLAMDAAFPGKDASEIKVPILRVPSLEAKYGKPKYYVMEDGSYLASYRWEKKYLKIVGTPRPTVPRSYGTDATFNLLGKTQGAYGTGNEDPEFTSKAATLTAPDGRSANYIIVYGGNRDFYTYDQLQKDVPRFGW